MTIPAHIITSATQASDAWQMPVTVWQGRTALDGMGLPVGYGALHTISIGRYRAWDDHGSNRVPVLTVLPYHWWEWQDWRKDAATHS